MMDFFILIVSSLMVTKLVQENNENNFQLSC